MHNDEVICGRCFVNCLLRCAAGDLMPCRKLANIIHIRQLELSHNCSRPHHGMMVLKNGLLLQRLAMINALDRDCYVCVEFQQSDKDDRHGFDWESAGIPVWGLTRALNAKRNVKPRAPPLDRTFGQRLSSR